MHLMINNMVMTQQPLLYCDVFMLNEFRVFVSHSLTLHILTVSLL